MESQAAEEEVNRPRKRKGELVLGQGQGAGADEDDFMVSSREQLKEGLDERAGRVKRKKHPPAKNGERPAIAARQVMRDPPGA